MKIRALSPRVFRPEVYQGRKQPGNYFEGWYFKLVDSTGKQIWSLIPGVAYSEDSHSFIQVIQAQTGHTSYIRFPLSKFSARRDNFQASIGPNHFSSDGLSLDLVQDGIHIKGDLQFENPRAFPSTLLSPGIMGWYAYAPRMECYHGVVSMHHLLSGSLEMNGDKVDFSGGRGYIEKDWGRSMPSDWIWIQSNHFEQDPDASFMVSLARIPWLKGYFPGFLSFFKTGDRLYRFATYNGSQVERIDQNEEALSLVLRNRQHRLKLTAIRRGGGILKAPRHGSMERDIEESVISRIELELLGRDGTVLFKGSGEHAGLEIVGDVAQYFNKYD